MTDSPIRDIEAEDWREAERHRVVRTRRALAAVLVVLAILLLIASLALVQIFQPVGKVANTTDASGLTWVRSIYGWGRGPNQQLVAPQGVAIGPDGTIWATDQGNSRVVGFHPDGTLASMLYQGVRTDPKSPNAFQFPTSVAVDENGLVYVGDQSGNNVYVMSPDNKVVRKIFVPTPSSVAVSSDRLVVGSASGFVILTKTGGVIKVLGSQGKGDKQFQGVRGVAIAKDDTIYAVDQYNNRVSAYDRNGVRKWIRVTGAPGNQSSVASSTVAAPGAEARLQLPAEIAVDGARRLVVVDPFGFDIAVLNAKDGTPIAAYGEAGGQDGQFTYPSGIAYDPQRDWFAVADTMNARVQIVRLPDSGGTVLATANRTFSGPIRALFIPLALLFLAIVTGLVYRSMNRRRQRDAADVEGSSGPAEPVVE